LLQLASPKNGTRKSIQYFIVFIQYYLRVLVNFCTLSFGTFLRRKRIWTRSAPL